jgi:hypothetical protein
VLPISVLLLTPGPTVTTRVRRGETTHQTPPSIGVERSDSAGHGRVANPVAALGRLVSRILALRQ